MFERSEDLPASASASLSVVGCRRPSVCWSWQTAAVWSGKSADPPTVDVAFFEQMVYLRLEHLCVLQATSPCHRRWNNRSGSAPSACDKFAKQLCAYCFSLSLIRFLDPLLRQLEATSSSGRQLFTTSEGNNGELQRGIEQVMYSSGIEATPEPCFACPFTASQHV